MGTNYYAHINICDKCNKPEHVLHIGKSSAGWTFTFRGYKNGLDIDSWEPIKLPKGQLVSFEDWKELLQSPDIKIINEYNEEIAYDDFLNIVENKKKEQFNHAKMVLEKHETMYPFGFDREYYNQNWLDEEGNSFTAGEFC